MHTSQVSNSNQTVKLGLLRDGKPAVILNATGLSQSNVSPMCGPAAIVTESDC